MKSETYWISSGLSELISPCVIFRVAVASVPAGAGVILYSGKRSLTLKPVDLDHYAGERGRRGGLLPRGFQRIEQLSVSE